jgi:hypothetical protein
MPLIKESREVVAARMAFARANREGRTPTEIAQLKRAYEMARARQIRDEGQRQLDELEASA